MKRKINSPLLVLSLAFLTFQTAKFDTPGSESKVGRGAAKIWPDDIPTEPKKTAKQASQETAKQAPPKASDLEVVEVEGPKKEAPESAPEVPKKPGFSFKRLFGFETKKEQPKVPVKTEEPAKLKLAEAEVSDEVKAVKTAVETIPPQIFERFTKLGVGIPIAEIKPDEARQLIDVGDKLLKLKPEDLNALNPEERLKVLTILNARAQQFSQGDSSAASSKERRRGAQADFDAGKITKNQLDKTIETENKKDVEVVEKFGFRKDDAAQTAASLDTLMKHVGTEISLRINVAKSQAAEIAQLAQQKTPLTPEQKQLRDSHMRNIAALSDLANKAETADPSETKIDIERANKKKAALELLLQTETKQEDITRLSLDLAASKKAVELGEKRITEIEEAKAQIPNMKKILLESQKVSKKLAASFIKDQKAQAKSLEKTITAKKAKLESTSKEDMARLGELDQEKVKKINERAPIKARMNELSEGVEKSQLPEEYTKLSETLERLTSEINAAEDGKQSILAKRKQEDAAIQELENQKKLILSGVDILQKALK